VIALALVALEIEATVGETLLHLGGIETRDHVALLEDGTVGGQPGDTGDLLEVLRDGNGRRPRSS
jgi:hypothetical protein